MSLHPDALAIHAGQVPEPAANARTGPNAATPSDVFTGAKHAARDLIAGLDPAPGETAAPARRPVSGEARG